jgi:hypothetical protein
MLYQSQRQVTVVAEKLALFVVIDRYHYGFFPSILTGIVIGYEKDVNVTFLICLYNCQQTKQRTEHQHDCN